MSSQTTKMLFLGLNHARSIVWVRLFFFLTLRLSPSGGSHLQSPTSHQPQLRPPHPSCAWLSPSPSYSLRGTRPYKIFARDSAPLLQLLARARPASSKFLSGARSLLFQIFVQGSFVLQLFARDSALKFFAKFADGSLALSPPTFARCSSPSPPKLYAQGSGHSPLSRFSELGPPCLPRGSAPSLPLCCAKFGRFSKLIRGAPSPQTSTLGRDPPPICCLGLGLPTSTPITLYNPDPHTVRPPPTIFLLR